MIIIINLSGEASMVLDLVIMPWIRKWGKATLISIQRLLKSTSNWSLVFNVFYIWYDLHFNSYWYKKYSTLIQASVYQHGWKGSRCAHWQAGLYEAEASGDPNASIVDPLSVPTTIPPQVPQWNPFKLPAVLGSSHEGGMPGPGRKCNFCDPGSSATDLMYINSKYQW